MTDFAKKDSSLTIRCSATTNAVIDGLAKENNCSRSSVIRWCLLEGLSAMQKVDEKRAEMNLGDALQHYSVFGISSVK